MIGAELADEAHRVERHLRRTVARFASLAPEHPHAMRLPFAGLYLCTTRAWLIQLASGRDRCLALHIMPRFYALYRQHVLDQLEAPLFEIPPHWWFYHRKARQNGGLSMLLAGIWAHIHFDLGVALMQATEAFFTSPAVQRLTNPRGLGPNCLSSGGLSLTRALWLSGLNLARLSGYHRARLREFFRKTEPESTA